MGILHWFAGIILAIELPVPIYWLVMHGGISFWRKRDRGRLPYWVAVSAAWGAGGWALYHFLRPGLFAAERPGWAIVAGTVLLLSDVAIFAIAESELGRGGLGGGGGLSGKGGTATGGVE